MTKSKFIRLSGWSFMLGSIAFSIFMISAFVESNFYDPYMRLNIFYATRVVFGIWVSSSLLAVGLLGLHIRYGEKVNTVGKHILLFGAIAGPSISLLGVIGSEAKIITWAWFLLYTGHIVLLACLTIFGILTLRTRPLSNWNGLPFVAGFWFPILLPLAMIANANGMSGSLILNIVKATIVLQSIALFLLGYTLQSNMLDKPSVTV